MKNQSIVAFINLKRTIKIMKLVLLLLIAGMSQVVASTYAQTASLTISAKNETLENVLKQIENQSEFLFFYQLNDINKDEKITVSKKNCNINELLDAIAHMASINYTIKERHIVLTSKKEAPKANSTVPQQERALTGVVTDVNGEPIIGANVVQKGTTHGTVTDLDGKFNLTVPENAILVVSYIGYVSRDVPIKSGVSQIILQDDTQKLSEVVVTALGIKRDEKALGYALQALDGSKLLETRDVNVTNSLTGKISGLQVVKGAGGVGGSSKIILRGQSSLTGDNQPLVVIDGIPMDNTASGNTDVWGKSGMDMGNGMQDINPDDIESLTVLKGASAAALYGSRAGNGVILITTKSGKQQQGLGITASVGIAIEDILITPKLQNDFAQGSDNIYNPHNDLSWGPKIEGQSFKNWNGQEEVLRTYDNMGNFFRTGVTDTEAVTFQQQIDKTSVYASINHMSNSSVVPETGMNRTSITARATTNLGKSDRWKMDVKVNYINTQVTNRPIQGINQSNAFSTIGTLPRSLDIRQFNPSVVNGKQIWFDTQTLPQDNPWWTLQYNQNDDTRNRFLSFVSLNYKFTDWLSAEIKAGADYYNSKMYHRKHSGSLAVPKNGIYEEGSKEFQENNYSFLFIAQKDNVWKKFSGSVTFGGNLMNQNISEMNASSGDLLIPDLFSINNGKDKPTITSLLTHRKMNSLYGSLQLSWNNALFVDLTARNDWSSTMSKTNSSYFYPSVSFSAIVSELVTLPEWFTFLKARASYAEVGNDLTPYQLYNSYLVNKNYWGNPIISSLRPSGDSYQNTLFNDGVRSELIKSWEAGLDLRFFRGRLKLDAAWYKTNATNQLLQLPMDETSGYQKRMINAGNIENSGVELSLSAIILESAKGLNWNTTVNFSKNNNQIVSLYPGVTSYNLATVDEITVLAEVGQTYGNMYGSILSRVKDKSSPHYGKLILSKEGLPQRDENTSSYLGNQQPKCLIGFNNSFSFKGINLDFMFDARIGGKMFSMTRGSVTSGGLAEETVVDGKRENFVVDGVISDGNGGYKTNDIAVRPQDYWRKALGQGNIGIAEANIYDASSVRLRNVSVGYTFDKKLLASTPFQRLKCSLTANNLWLIHTGVPGIDPEAVSGTGTNVTALELGAAPTTRSFTFNITVGF